MFHRSSFSRFGASGNPDTAQCAEAALPCADPSARHAQWRGRYAGATKCWSDKLRCDDVDRTAGGLRLRDGKTGARLVPLTPSGIGRVRGHPPVPDNPWVLLGKKPGAHLANVGVPCFLVRTETVIIAAWKQRRAGIGMNRVGRP